MKVHILDDWSNSIRSLPSFSKLAGHDVTIWNDQASDIDTLANRLKDAEAVVLFRERTTITADLIARLPNLQLIALRGAYPHVDVDAATKNGVLVVSNQKKAAPSFAAPELAWGLILAAARQIPQQMQSLADGTWQSGIGMTLHKKTIGLYGYGRIAKIVAGYARAFGMNVVWWASEDGRARADADGETVAPSRQSFFAESDIVSLHLRVVDATRGIVTADDLALMRSDAILVNTARAALIRRGALFDALNTGRPGMAALDVFDEEPILHPNDPLATHPRVIATPHLGFVTKEELDLQFSDIFDGVNAFADGKPIDVINPQVLSD